MKKVFQIRLVISAMLIVGTVFIWSTSSHSLFGGGDCEKAQLCVDYLDIGQGDATLIESPTGVRVLIDGGPGSGVLRELGRQMSFFDRTIDVIIATHPDKDHIGGLVDVLKRYAVGTIILTENKSETPVSELFQRRVEEEEAEVIYARRGMIFDLGEGVVLEILFPDRNPAELESNTASIVSRLVYGETEFLFTGDSPKSIEEYLVSISGSGLESDVLKVGHHGSKTSTAETFVSAVDPDFAIVSAGKDNRYGHPHAEVLGILDAYTIETKNTADVGSISVVSDGQEIFLK